MDRHRLENPEMADLAKMTLLRASGPVFAKSGKVLPVVDAEQHKICHPKYPSIRRAGHGMPECPNRWYLMISSSISIIDIIIIIMMIDDNYDTSFIMMMMMIIDSP